MASGNGNGSLLFTRLTQIPWVPIVTIIGWISFALSFYWTTKDALDQHSKQISQILSSRDKLVSEYGATQKQMADGINELNKQVALRTQEGANTQALLADAIRRLEVREDKIVSLLDTLYATQQEMLQRLNRQEERVRPQ